MKVAVLLGGDSPERDVSLASGAAVIKALRARGHAAVAVDPAMPPGTPAEPAETSIGERPPERPAPLRPEEVFAWLHAAPVREADVVMNALHGVWGEDGVVQALLEAAGLAYTGSGVLGSALAMNKDRSKALFREAGVPTARHLLVDAASADAIDRAAAAIVRDLGLPVVVKPNCQGSSVGFSYVTDEAGLGEALRGASCYGGECVAERYVPGRELTAAILGGEALPLVEIVPEGGFYDYRRKYQKGSSRYFAPADIDGRTAALVKRHAARAFEALVCRDYARVDFRLSPGGEPFCLEVNTLPGMTELSLVPMAARAAGIGFEELVERICRMALARKR